MSAINASHFATAEADGGFRLNMLVDGMHCPSCVAIIEDALKKQPGILSARLNLSTRRLAVKWTGEKSLADRWVQLINSMGYKAMPFDPETTETVEKREEKFLLRCLAAAGFASGNLMLFSIPLWTTDSIEMGEATRTMFQWVQALIAMPAIAYAGIPFYRSAWNALREYHTNMDVPISAAVILATLMSLFETLRHGQHAYFDSAVMLLFFLLIGRYLEARARGAARSAAHDLLQMMTGFSTVLKPDGSKETLPVGELAENMVLLVSAGEKIGADGDIIEGISEIDTSLITGETIPHPVQPGSSIHAGTINLSAPIKMKVTRAGERSLIAEIVRLMETAEQSQAKAVSLADRVSRWYTPLVHLLAALTFLGWWLGTQVEWQVSLLYAATVLIITCPCALGLAVPVVQVLASGILMRRGILIKSGSALERLASITHIAFDKTGTLTIGKPALLESENTATLQLAASMAVHSKHPLSQAIAAAYRGSLLSLTVREVPGYGLETEYNGRLIKLGKRNWAAPEATEADSSLELWLAIAGERPTRFRFADQLREDALPILEKLRKRGLKMLILSGDRPDATLPVAQELGIENGEAGLTPVEKCERLEALKTTGAKLMMVGDGLNDTPSLAASTVSMSPASALDITQNTADIVFQGKLLQPVLTTWEIARFSQKLVQQNFVLALAYNIFAIPLAVAGFVTPVIAAIAMSSSSLLVIGNAMRLKLFREAA